MGRLLFAQIEGNPESDFLFFQRNDRSISVRGTAENLKEAAGFNAGLHAGGAAHWFALCTGLQPVKYSVKSLLGLHGGLVLFSSVTVIHSMLLDIFAITTA